MDLILNSLKYFIVSFYGAWNIVNALIKVDLRIRCYSLATTGDYVGNLFQTFLFFGHSLLKRNGFKISIEKLQISCLYVDGMLERISNIDK